jgi:hypothetical protein
MSQSDGEENNAAVRRGNNVDLEAAREEEGCVWLMGRRSKRK